MPLSIHLINLVQALLQRMGNSMESVQSLSEVLVEVLDDYTSGKATFQITACTLVELAEDDDGIVVYSSEEDKDEVITCMFPDPNCQFVINYTDKSIFRQ